MSRAPGLINGTTLGKSPIGEDVNIIREFGTNMKKNFYNYDDGVELRLSHYAGPYYEIEWHFTDKVVERRFLGIRYKKTVKDKWRTVLKYRYPNVSQLNRSNNPFDDRQWEHVTVRSDSEPDVEKFKALKAGIKTYADFDKKFHREDGTRQWQSDMEKWNKLQEEANDRVKGLL